MQTLILPGFSPKNKKWLDECANALKIDGIVRPITWDHWLDDSQVFDPKEKAWLIARHTKGDEINIVAKSIGCLVASYVIQAIPTQINKVILNGVPTQDIDSEQKDIIITSLSQIDPKIIICFQNSHDPHGSFGEVRTLLPQTIKMIQKESSDHEYPYFEDFNEFLL